jgi:hypothetical protein
MSLDLKEIRRKNKLHSSRAVRPEEIDAMLDRIEELESRCTSDCRRCLLGEGGHNYRKDYAAALTAERDNNMKSHEELEKKKLDERDALQEPATVPEEQSVKGLIYLELVKRIEELEGLNAELVESSRQDWLKSPAFQTFIDLKHGPIGTILMLLQEGQISRGKCAEALAELAHGIAPEDARLPAFSESVFTDDQTPSEVCAAKDAEITRLTAERDNLRSVCAEAYQLAGAVGAPARVLDRLIAAAQGTDIGESFLPVSPDECRRNQTLNWPHIKSRLVDRLFSLTATILVTVPRAEVDEALELLTKHLGMKAVKA